MHIELTECDSSSGAFLMDLGRYRTLDHYLYDVASTIVGRPVKGVTPRWLPAYCWFQDPISGKLKMIVNNGKVQKRAFLDIGMLKMRPMWVRRLLSEDMRVQCNFKNREVTFDWGQNEGTEEE